MFKQGDQFYLQIQITDKNDNILDGKTFSARFRHSTYRTVGLESWDLDYNAGKFGLWFRYKSLNNTKDYANQENVWYIFYKFNTSTNKLTSRIYQGQTSGTPLIRYYRYGADEETMSNMALSINNSDEYIPTKDYHPATKKYVDDKLTTITGYDATKTQTLKNINGVLTWQTDGE